MLALAALATAIGLGALIVHLRLHVVPPGCGDPRTLARVAPHVPEGEHIARHRTLAGGPLAFRFVCEADLEGERALVAHYVSRLNPADGHHEVTVSISPVLSWQRVE